MTDIFIELFKAKSEAKGARVILAPHEKVIEYYEYLTGGGTVNMNQITNQETYFQGVLLIETNLVDKITVL
jgi:hypothetical protein